MTSDKVQSLASRSFELQKQRVDLREAYFKKISQAVSPKTAARFVQVEDRLDLLLNLQLASNIPMVQEYAVSGNVGLDVLRLSGCEAPSLDLTTLTVATRYLER